MARTVQCVVLSVCVISILVAFAFEFTGNQLVFSIHNLKENVANLYRGKTLTQIKGEHATPASINVTSQELQKHTPYKIQVDKPTFEQTHGQNPGVQRCVSRRNANLTEHCQVTFAPRGHFPATALVSFPGSGNTWVRHMMEAASGFFTSSFYKEGFMLSHGFCGERVRYRLGTTIVYKNHFFHYKPRALSPFDMFVLIIRNPFKAIVADFNRVSTKNNHTGLVKRKMFASEDFKLFAKKRIAFWGLLNTAILDCKKPVHVVHYEDIEKNDVLEMKRVLIFLDVPFPDTRVGCLKTGVYDTFKRPIRKKCDAIDPFNKELKTLVFEQLKIVNRSLKRKGLREVNPQYDLCE